ncbi:MAG: type VI secretion system membrane subunit TssM [Legionellales bacterium]|nr:type VI secretion system membrane subunit TssM [Legionellales bacterium]|tara:strand:- start:10583 stop:13957 length:3375 start_codon:yes stop_codon:yes gene_type:complete
MQTPSVSIIQFLKFASIKLINALPRRLLIVGGGLLVVGAMLAWLAPLLGIDSWWLRSFIVIVPLIIGILWRMHSIIHAWLQNNKLSQTFFNPSVQGDNLGKQLELNLLKEKLQHAVKTVQRNQRGFWQRQAALYQLPWYVLIGPSAAGKSSLLRHSDLNFPLANTDDIRVQGYGGTRNCDWWFADEGIILDTAGRYTTATEDEAEWLRFLGLLKRYRPKYPLNGILITLSLPELCEGDKQDLQRHVTVISQRINEIFTRLGYVVPVTIILSKIDLLPGFDAFAKDLSAESANAPFGVDLSATDVDSSAALQAGFDELRETLFAKQLQTFAHHDSPTFNSRVYLFNQAFTKAATQVSALVELLITDSPYRKSFHCQGVYFTSSLQDCTDESNSRSYFVKNLFYRVILPHQHAIIPTPEQRRRQQTVNTTVAFLCLGSIIATAWLYHSAYHYNKHQLQQFALAGKQLSAELLQSGINQQTFVDMIALAEQQQAAISKHKTPWHLRLGLNRQSAMALSLEQLLQRIVRHYYQPTSMPALASQLQHYHTQWQQLNKMEQQRLRGEYYITLKAYLMLADPGNMRADAIAPLLVQHWQHTVGIPRLSKQQKTVLETLMGNYLTVYGEQNHSQPINNQLVDSARKQLATGTSASNIYAALKQHLQQTASTLSLQQVLGAPAQPLSTAMGLPTMYTKKGFDNSVLPAIKQLAATSKTDAWVMGIADDSHHRHAHLDDELLQAYYADSQDQWRYWLGTIHIQPFSTALDASQQLHRLAKANGPLAHLLTAIDTNLGFTMLNYQPTKSLQQALMPALMHLADPIDEAAIKVNSNKQRFTAAQALLTDKGDPSNLSTTLATVNQQLQGLTDPSQQALLRPLFYLPLKTTWEYYLQGAGEYLQQRWQQTLFPVYQTTIAGKFPFAHHGQIAYPEDIDSFFAPSNGIFWQFVQTELAGFIERGDQHWVTQQWLDEGLQLSSSFMASLNRASYWTQHLYGIDPQHLRTQFAVYPTPTRNVSSAELRICDKHIHYANGPQQWHQVQCPNQGINDSSVLTVTDSNGRSYQSTVYSGSWGFLQLLQTATLERLSPISYRLHWQLQQPSGNKVILESLLQDPQKSLTMLLQPQIQLPRRMIQ